MGHTKERDLLRPCRAWLCRFLSDKYRRATITILPDTDRMQLRHSLNKAGLSSQFPESSAWEVRVDVAAVVARANRTSLAFVELKARPLLLRDVGQLLGYCRVCQPIIAFLLSSEGLSPELDRLLKAYGRTDVLSFGADSIRVGSWHVGRASPDWSTIIPPGALSTIAGRPQVSK